MLSTLVNLNNLSTSTQLKLFQERNSVHAAHHAWIEKHIRRVLDQHITSPVPINDFLNTDAVNVFSPNIK